MGVIAAGVAIYFMEAHKVIKKLWTRLGLDVRPLSESCAQPEQHAVITGKFVCPQGHQEAVDAPGPKCALPALNAQHALHSLWALHAM